MVHYMEKDGLEWTQIKDEPLFKQWKTYPEDCDIVLQKIRVVTRASFKAVVDTIMDYERRMSWDEDIYDFEVLYQSPDKSRRRFYYAVKAPVSITHRDFYLDEH